MITTTLLTRFAQFGAECDPTAGQNSFFGLTPWYAYLPGKQDSFGKCVASFNSINDFWLIGLAVVDSLLKVVALVAIGFVIFGGFQYMTSSGEPDKTKKAKDSILNALIGLAIAIVAASIVSFIGGRLR
jgi:hypothetical protein